MTDSSTNNASKTPTDTGSPSRRQFLATTASAASVAAAATSLGIGQVAHAAENGTLKIGLVGCGGRGSGAALQATLADPNVKLVSVGDAFKDQAERFAAGARKNGTVDRWGKPIRDKVDLPAERVFVGFDAYKHVVDSCDVVVFATSPHFRPLMIEYAVKQGKHMFAEKPVATDVPHLKRVKAACDEAEKKGLAVVSGLCYRYERAKQELMKRIHDGMIGDIVGLHCYYMTGTLWHRGTRAEHPEWSEMEYQMRNWLYFNWLSGDHIVEQHIHSLDKMAWVLKDQTPEYVQSTGGRIHRTDEKFGDIYDHFCNHFMYEDGLEMHSHCRQMKDCAYRVSDHVIGTKGTADIMRHYLRDHEGDIIWRHRRPRGRNVVEDNMYQNEHDDLFASIRKGEPINNGKYMVNSTMLAIMARNSAYTGKKITWDQAWDSTENLAPAKYEWGDLPRRPVPVPGKTAIA